MDAVQISRRTAVDPQTEEGRQSRPSSVCVADMNSNYTVLARCEMPISIALAAKSSSKIGTLPMLVSITAGDLDEMPFNG
jgi:hypothetical protein